MNDYSPHFEILGHKEGGACAVNLPEARLLTALVENANPDVLLEVGRWKGHSTVALTEGLSRRSQRLISVDIKPKNDGILSKVLHELRFGGCVELVTSPYDKQVLELTNSVGLLDFAFIDGDHEYKACYSDLVLTWRNLKPGGLMVVHDALSSRLRVGEACRDFADAYGADVSYVPTDPYESGSPDHGDGMAIIFKR